MRDVYLYGGTIRVSDDDEGLLAEMIEGALAREPMPSFEPGGGAVLFHDRLVVHRAGDDRWIVSRLKPGEPNVELELRGSELRALVEQAQILADRPRVVDASADDFPVGAMIADDRFALTELLRGGPDRGVYRGRDANGTALLVTMGSKIRVGYTELGASLELDAAGVMPLRWIGPVAAGGGRWDALVEAEPDGAPLASLELPLAMPQVASIGRQVARILAEVHRDGRALNGLRPETIYVAGESISGVAPRGETFLSHTTPLSYGVPHCYDLLYAAPEVLAGKPATPASDLFSLCAVLAHCASGAHPFEGFGAARQLIAITSGQRRTFAGPAVIEQGLAADPARRPSIAELLEALR